MTAPTAPPRSLFGRSRPAQVPIEGRRIASKPVRARPRDTDQLLRVRNEMIRQIIDDEQFADMFGDERDRRGVRVKIAELARIFNLTPDHVRALVREARALRLRIRQEADECV